MNWLVAIAEFVVNEILAVPAYLIGIITAVGLIALRKSTGQVIGGASKATRAFLPLGPGAGLLRRPVRTTFTFTAFAIGLLAVRAACAFFFLVGAAAGFLSFIRGCGGGLGDLVSLVQRFRGKWAVR